LVTLTDQTAAKLGEDKSPAKAQIFKVESLIEKCPSTQTKE
jgi:hypothetical protein